MKKYLICFIMAALLAACGGETITPTLVAEVTDVPPKTATHESSPTGTPAPIVTPLPADTPTPLPPLSESGGGVIAFTSERDGNREIYIMNADGSDQRNLTNNPARDAWPTWSPDGTQIAFNSTETATPTSS